MRKNHARYFVAGAVLAAGGLYGLAVGDLLTFKAGDPIRSSEVNSNFSTLKAAVAALEAPIGVSRLAVAGTAADGKVLKLQGGNLAWADDIVGSPGTTYNADGTSLQLSGTTFSVRDGGVTGAKIGLPLSLLGSSGTTLSVTNSGGNALSSVSGNGGIGVLGRSSARGMVGTQGDLGLSCAGTYGVGGCATEGAGVSGNSQTGIGVLGNSTTRGVVGTLGGTPCAGTYAVGGCAESATGVYGTSSSSRGVEGVSSTGIGVLGNSNARGVVGTLGGTSCRGDLAYAMGGCAAGTGFSAVFVGGSGGTGLCTFNGSAGWSCTSDRNKKENFREVDARMILEALAKLPITRWNMKGDANKTPHIGPTAQDFYAAFGLGEDDKTINAADAQGVALAAIKGLYQENQALKAQNAELARRMGELEAQMAGIQAMQAKLANLEARLGSR